MDEYIAIIKLFAGSYAIRGWAYCDGQILNVAQNQAVYSLLGTTYGGNGTTTFALPDLRGRVAIGSTFGSNTPAGSYTLGQIGGAVNVTMSVNQMPTHTHQAVVTPGTPAFIADSSVGNSANPAGNRLAMSPKTGSGPNASTLNTYTTSSANPVSMGSTATQPTVAIGAMGGNQPFSILQPFAVLNYIFCLEGLYPTRN